MFMRRRRPLMRAAIVGGAAYHAGKRRQEAIEQDEMTEMRLQELEAQQSMQQAPPQPSAAVPVEELKQLADLREQGILTEDEFEQQKRRLLGAS